MYLEYILGPVIAALISMKFTKYTDTKAKQYVDTTAADLRKELVTKCDSQNDEMAKKLLVTVSPMAKALREVKETLGV